MTIKAQAFRKKSHGLDEAYKAVLLLGFKEEVCSRHHRQCHSFCRLLNEKELALYACYVYEPKHGRSLLTKASLHQADRLTSQ
jgi:hypothetical protein